MPKTTSTQNLELDDDTNEGAKTHKRQSLEGAFDENDMNQNRHAA